MSNGIGIWPPLPETIVPDNAFWVAWQLIETAPKDGTGIILYWPSHSYDKGDEGSPCIDIGRWKFNDRIKAGYFSNTGEWDDYGLAEPHHAPTHWMPIQKPPV